MALGPHQRRSHSLLQWKPVLKPVFVLLSRTCLGSGEVSGHLWRWVGRRSTSPAFSEAVGPSIFRVFFGFVNPFFLLGLNKKPPLSDPSRSSKPKAQEAQGLWYLATLGGRGCIQMLEQAECSARRYLSPALPSALAPTMFSALISTIAIANRSPKKRALCCMYAPFIKSPPERHTHHHIFLVFWRHIMILNNFAFITEFILVSPKKTKRQFNLLSPAPRYSERKSQQPCKRLRRHWWFSFNDISSSRLGPLLVLALCWPYVTPSFSLPGKLAVGFPPCGWLQPIPRREGGEVLLLWVTGKPSRWVILHPSWHDSFCPQSRGSNPSLTMVWGRPRRIVLRPGAGQHRPV